MARARRRSGTWRPAPLRRRRRPRDEKDLGFLSTGFLMIMLLLFWALLRGAVPGTLASAAPALRIYLGLLMVRLFLRVVGATVGILRLEAAPGTLASAAPALRIYLGRTELVGKIVDYMLREAAPGTLACPPWGHAELERVERERVERRGGQLRHRRGARGGERWTPLR